MDALISVVVPSYQHGAYLEAALESLLSQDQQEVEIIVVDGGSSDQSIGVIRKYESRLTRWVSEPDAGQSDAINKGFAMARGEWLTWLNSDDLLLPGAIASFRRSAASDPEARWFAGGGWMIDESGQKVRAYDPPSRCLRAEDLVPWTDTWFGQPGTFFRRDLFESAGGKIQADLSYAMDLDLWLRMGKIDSLHPVPSTVGAYRLHQRSKTVAQRDLMECEVVRVFLTQMGPEAALKRVAVLARERFELEARYRRLTGDLRNPAGWGRLLRRRIDALYEAARERIGRRSGPMGH